MPYKDEIDDRNASDTGARSDTSETRKRLRKSNRDLAKEAGISLRTFYRMRKEPQRCHTRQQAARLTAQVLAELGHPELLGTDAHRYIEDFLAEFAERMAVLHDEQPQAIEVRLARHNARMLVDSLKRWQVRRARIYDELLQQDKTDLFGFRA